MNYCITYRIKFRFMNTSKSFKDLIVWEKAHAFVLSIYRLSKSFPSEEKFGLTSQFRRAAISIAANIAEGYKKTGQKDKLRFFNISQGSIEECRYYLILAKDLEYCSNDIYEEELLEEVSKLLSAYSKKIYQSL